LGFYSEARELTTGEVYPRTPSQHAEVLHPLKARLSRRALEEILVEEGRYGSSNVLRAVRGLARMRFVSLHEGPNLDQSYVSLPPPAEPVSDELAWKLIAEFGDRP
jgi:hypothetical protein